MADYPLVAANWVATNYPNLNLETNGGRFVDIPAAPLAWQGWLVRQVYKLEWGCAVLRAGWQSGHPHYPSRGTGFRPIFPRLAG